MTMTRLAAGNSDLNSVQALINSCYEDGNRLAQRSVEYLKGCLAVVITEENGEAVSTASILEEDGRLYIKSVATHPSHRRKGYASQTLEYALKLAREKGAKSVYAEVAAENQAALRLFDELGFKLYDYEDLTDQRTGEQYRESQMKKILP